MMSRLEIYDLAAGQAETLLAVKDHIEAPNWSPDGQTLLVNGGGRLFRVALDAPRLEQVDVTGLTGLNNDHGISSDGITLVVSDSPARDTSLIYTLPIDGGMPTRVTDQAPSWWHGWSPDGATLAYTCVRDGQFGIATCPATGGDETVLITSPHHYDGPDYTPDGGWIWFNSDRSGLMELWHMRTDGSGLEQMTEEPSVNWFPHPSPDGRHVLYLAYPPGTEGHPAGRPVALRLLDTQARTTRELITLWGGQGTLNVPCWAPDGQKFAFMSYAQSEPQEGRT